MKAKLFFILAAALCGSFVRGQGFIIDQQSITGRYEGVAGLGQQPLGQSFTPTLLGVGFIRLNIISAIGNTGGTLFVNLRQDSITGTVLNSTTPVLLSAGFSGAVDFLFSAPVAVTPGTIYYFQLTFQDSPGFGVSSDNTGNPYSGGTAFVNGLAVPMSDLWFQEGLVVPEPSSVWLGLVAGSILFYVRRRQQIRSRV